MKKVKKYMRDKPHIAVSVPTSLCVVSFLQEIAGVFKEYGITLQHIKDVLSSTNGLEAILLLIVMIILRKKNQR